jgi:hypothetical protein
MKNNFTFLAVLSVALLGWIVACNEKEEPTFPNLSSSPPQIL